MTSETLDGAPVQVSAAGGDHPSRDQWQPIEAAPKDEVVGVAGGCAYWNSDEGRWYSITGEEWPGRPIEWPVTHYKRLSPKTLPPAPAIEARSAETAGLGPQDESAAGEAGAPDADVWKGLQAGAADVVRQLEAETKTLREEVERLREALTWYGEQARLCRLIHSEGDAGRHALEADGGVRARAALTPPPTPV